MTLFRLVNSIHDPIEIGSALIRCSDHSNQKLGCGMYFAETRKGAMQFGATKHGHNYTHLLTCSLKDLSRDDFVDLIADPRQIDRSEFKSLLYAERGPAFAKKHGKKGLIWKGASGWIEVCLFAEHIEGSVIIEAVEVLTFEP